MNCPKCGCQILSPRAERTLDYMRKNAPRRGGFMFEGARPNFENGTYHDAELEQLLAAGAILPHADPAKGWIVNPDY